MKIISMENNSTKSQIEKNKLQFYKIIIET